MLTRRAILPAAAAASLAPLAALPAVARLNMEGDPWVRLCAERAMIFRIVGDSVIDGNIPDEVSDPAWARVEEIDTEIAASAPTTVEGLRAALIEFKGEMDGGSMPTEESILALLNAALAFVNGALS